MSPVIYQSTKSLPDGKYLPGQYSWPSAKQLAQVLVNGQRPTSGTLKLYMEIGGVLTDFFIEVSSGSTRFVISKNLFANVPAKAVVRWKAVYDGSVEDSAWQVCLTLTVVPGGSLVAPKLTVRDGGSGIVYYTYDPSTHRFTNVVPLGISPAWTLAQFGDTSLTIGFGVDVVFQVAGQTVYSNNFYAMGGVSTLANPRAVFYVDNVPIATLTVNDLRVTDLFESAVPVLSAYSDDFYRRFEFWSAGILTGSLDGSGLMALNVVETNTP